MHRHIVVLKQLHKAGHRDIVEYVQTIEAHNQLLQDELEQLTQLITGEHSVSELLAVADKATAVLEYTRAYSNRGLKGAKAQAT